MNENATRRLYSPYSIGVVLAVNALRDAYLLLDAPECALWRPGFVHGSHDLTSTLWDPSGVHRVQVSGTSTEKLATGDFTGLGQRLTRLAQVPGCGAVLAVGFPMATISGVPYETIWKNLSPRPAVPLVVVRGGATSHDWLDGYAQTLAALARDLPLAAMPRRDDAVAVVGYLYDRGERDHVANLAELHRMLAGCGLDLVSVWPSGGRVADLARVATAGTILSLPYGREAASRLAERTGARLVELDLPLGLEGSAAWLARVGAAIGREADARRFAEHELRRLVPRLERVVADVFAGATFAFAGDPVLVRPLALLLGELGSRLALAIGFAAGHHRATLGPFDDLPFPVVLEPSEGSSRRIVSETLADVPVDGLIGADLPAWSELPTGGRPVELGYPSYRSHALHDRPYFGFEGTLCLVSRLAEELAFSRGATRP